MNESNRRYGRASLRAAPVWHAMRCRARVPCLLLLMLVMELVPMQAAMAQAAPAISDAQLVASLARSFTAQYGELAQRGAALREAVTALCAEPASADRLAAARTAWRQAAVVVRTVEAWPLGPTLEFRALPRVDFWPTRVPQIDAAIADQQRGTLDLTKVGVTARGLPALEYLLFDAGKGTPALAGAAQCQYAQALAAEVAQLAAELHVAWQGWSTNAALADADKAKALVGDTLNVVVAALNGLRARKLARPAATPGQPPPAPTWDAWRSGATRDLVLATLDGVRMVLMGDEAAGAPGLLALLRGRGHAALAQQLADRFAAAEAAAKALPADPSRASARAYNGAMQALAQLQEGLAGETATALKVTMGYNDSDGD